MKYKVEAENIEIVEPVTDPVEESVSKETSRLETALTNFLADVVKCKHSYITCDCITDCLREVGACTTFALNVYWPNWIFPEIPAAEKGSSDKEDIISALSELMKTADDVATLASEEHNWLVVKKMQFSLGKLGETINTMRKKDDK